MNEIIDALILGIIQGLTEFLPVSSSGHLELGKALVGFEGDGDESLMMTIVLHAATALSTVFVFRNDIAKIVSGLFTTEWNEHKSFSLYIILSMVPAALIGIFFLDEIEALFIGNIVLVGIALLFTGILLFIADRAKESKQTVGLFDSILVGIAQAIAIIPGISRSGATISTSVLLGLDKEQAARFSFLMVVPLILAKMAKDILSGELFADGANLVALGFGFSAALLTGIFACKWMISIVKNSQLKYFAYYCFVVGVIAIILSL